MVDSMTVAFPADELHLAQLACVKLAGMVQGTLSVGLCGLVGDAGYPRYLFDKYFEVITGYAQVLDTTCGTREGHEVICHLRERSGVVLGAVAKLRDDVFACLDAKGDILPSLRAACDSALTLMEAIREYGRMVDADDARLLKSKQTVCKVFDGVEAHFTSKGVEQ